MIKRKISIISSAIRTDLWPQFIDSFKKNKCEYEIIFVGPIKPNFNLPNFCKYIKANVKPPQCWEIGLRNASNELILIMADDTFFVNNLALDNLLEIWERHNKNNKLIISNKYSIENDLFDEDAFKIRITNTEKPIFAKLKNGSDIKIPFQPLFHKNLIKEIGGLDNRFVITCWEIDIFLNAIIRNYRIIDSNEIIDEKRFGTTTSTNLGDYSTKDFKMLFELWFDDQGYILSQRSENIKYYDQQKIFSITQGNKGKWIYTNETYSKFITSKYYSFFKKNYNQFKSLVKSYLFK